MSDESVDVTTAFTQAGRTSLRCTVTYLESASMLFRQAGQGIYVNLTEDLLNKVQAIVDTIPEKQA